MVRLSVLCVAVLLLMVAVTDVAAAEKDFYELLGVDRSATAREIRKAFKKVALEKHPDKNKDDPDAHEQFLRINRAYEVLKDEDLRKKYDTHGEAGLKEDGPSGRGYKSWNFYQNDFGIYDNDDEIITLSASDFEQSVENTDDIWFVNFYSPQCSHCHDLAPSWRELARELEGVIRIGAVNCGDDWGLCRQQRIQSYPSLIMYPQREKYHGSKTTKELVKYALQQVGAVVYELWSGNFKDSMEENTDHPWLISFCGDGGDCVEHSTVVKLSAMLDELVNVGELHCHSNEKICSKLGVEYGTYYYDAGKVEKGAGIPISSLDTKEIFRAVLNLLPEVDELLEADYNDALDDGTWLMIYTDGTPIDPELKKLPALLDELNVGQVDCTKLVAVCNELHITKFPQFIVMKPGGRYEFHHGRQTAHDIAAFTRLSADARVETLGPEDFPQRVISNGEPWFVDFFAPWCPPCMRLLPEFRKASKAMPTIHFGTVDCVIHQQLCQQYNVRSYPTTIFYNQTVPHQFHGHHASHHIVEFIQDTLSPPVMNLDPESFPRLVGNKGEKEIWLVDFFSPHCGPCQQLAPEWRRLAKMIKDVGELRIAQVDCLQHRDLCSEQGVRGYPSIRLYPAGKANRKFHQYNGWFRDAPSLRAWAYEFLPSAVTSLDWNSFQAILTSDKPWIVDFYAPWCGHCQVFAPEFDKVARSLEGVVRAGKVDCDRHGRLCQQARIGGYPTVNFYKGATAGTKQSFVGQEIQSLEANSIISFLKRTVKKSSTKKPSLKSSTKKTITIKKAKKNVKSKSNSGTPKKKSRESKTKKAVKDEL